MTTYFRPTVEKDVKGVILVEGPCDIIRPLEVTEADIFDVGPMFVIQQAPDQHGERHVVHAFGDELTEE